MSLFGTVVRGIKTPVISSGDDLISIVVESVLCAQQEGVEFCDRDVVAVTEAVVARAQGNYATTDQIAADIRQKFGGDTLGVVFPILSRNRFSVCLKGIAKGVKKIYLQLSYPSDEVGNEMFDYELLDDTDINPYCDVLDEKKYRELFGFKKHIFTGMDYVDYYSGLIKDCGCEVEVIFANQAKAILDYTKNVLVCDIHSRHRSKKLLKKHGAQKVFGLDDVLSSSVDGSGHNEKFGLLGSNKASDDMIKLFPREGQAFVDALSNILSEATGKKIEALIYGDGAFKDPTGKIWELADPVVSPAYTKGLEGKPNELKLKYLADNDFAHLKGEELSAAIKEKILKKEEFEVTADMSLGTTPRDIPSLIGSLCDLTSGSGDKGTPVVLVQGYFNNYSK